MSDGESSQQNPAVEEFATKEWHRNQLFQDEDSSEDDEGPAMPQNNQGSQQNDYCMKIEIPQFNGLFVIEEFLD
ncbi:hypothetical protein PanWU01x14_284070 [Parasponia andersonii]|uniref:Uncharacterized protein n=1 Tax=Parasponia andersonii TaxID=3476 RepID=A0A2P5B029_PARAD|nr:hypothetical protein PanWU01x14_284070 [Parasponia andersonii]